MLESIIRLLKESGCTAETAENVGRQIANEVGKVTVPKKEYNAKIALVNDLKGQLNQSDARIENLKKAADLAETLSKQLFTLQNKHDARTSELKLQIEALEFSRALDVELFKAGAKNIKAVKALIDLQKLRFSAKTGIDGLDIQLKSLMVTDGYLFKMPLKKVNIVKRHRTYG